MTNEEKARAYDEALDWMRSVVYPTLTGSAKEDAEHFFPALKESEDERVIKRLSSLVRILNSEFFKGDNPSKEQCLAYLEKQKEQKGSKVVKFDHDREQKPAEWMARQGVQDSIEGTICGRVDDHVNVKFPDWIGQTLEPKSVSHIPANVKNYNIGDAVIVQIRKKQ